MWRLRSVIRKWLSKRLFPPNLWHGVLLCAIPLLGQPFWVFAESDFSIETSWAFDGRGRLWQASATHGRVILKVSEDKGKSFVPAAQLVAGQIAEKPQAAHATQLSRPQMVIDSADNIYIVWRQVDQGGGQRVWFSRSIHQGSRFEAPISIQEPAQAAVPAPSDAYAIQSSQVEIPPITLVVAEDMAIYLAWQSAHANGAGLYLAISHNQGQSFQPVQRVATSACPTGGIAIAPKQTQGTVVLWSHPFEAGTHDLALAELGQSSANVLPHRVTHAKKHTTACTGQALALARGDQQGQSWGWHIAWQEPSNDAQAINTKGRLHFARMDGAALVASPVRRFGDASQVSGQIALHSRGEQVWLAWQAHTANGTQILGAESQDGGRSWSQPSVWMQSPGKGGSVQILSEQKTHTPPYLLWQTQDGLQVSRLEGNGGHHEQAEIEH